MFVYLMYGCMMWYTPCLFVLYVHLRFIIFIIFYCVSMFYAPLPFYFNVAGGGVMEQQGVVQTSKFFLKFFLIYILIFKYRCGCYCVVILHLCLLSFVVECDFWLFPCVLLRFCVFGGVVIHFA